MKYAASLLVCLTPLFAQVLVPQPPPSPGMVCMQAAPDGVTCTFWANAPHAFGTSVFGLPSLASFFRAPVITGSPAPLPVSITITPSPIAVLVPPPTVNFFALPASAFAAGSLKLNFPSVGQQVQIDFPAPVNPGVSILPSPPSINIQVPQNLTPLVSGIFNRLFSLRPPK